MLTKIDKQGRIVVPKELRERLQLRGGDPLQIDELDGRLEIRRTGTNGPLVETSEGILTMEPGPGFGPAEVRELLERTRR